MLEMREQEKDQTEDYIKTMEFQIREKEKKLQSVIEELTRKSNLNEDELLFLKGQIDKERRKSMADEQKMMKLQQVLEENSLKTADRIRMIEQELENERRKSMADEETCKKLEKALNQKIYFLSELTRRKSEDDR